MKWLFPMDVVIYSRYNLMYYNLFLSLVVLQIKNSLTLNSSKFYIVYKKLDICLYFFQNRIENRRYKITKNLISCKIFLVYLDIYG